MRAHMLYVLPSLGPRRNRAYIMCMRSKSGHHSVFPQVSFLLFSSFLSLYRLEGFLGLTVHLSDMRTFNSRASVALTVCSVAAMARAAGFPPPSTSAPPHVSQSVSGATMRGTSGGVHFMDFGSASGSASGGSTATSVKAFQDTLVS